MKEILLAMMLWIHNATGYTIPSDLPEIVYVDSFEIRTEAYGCDLEKVPESSIEVCDSSHLWFVDELDKKNIPLGLYNHEDEIIFVNSDMMKSEAHDRSVIFHELVHHMQYKNGVYDSISCFGQLEEQAYNLQNDWLQEKYGVTVYETIGINELFMMVIISCGERFY
tara:strand:+ start:3313 stop:3813 length:501 start_codon:yes stop_codon:yes gene_type:complete